MVHISKQRRRGRGHHGGGGNLYTGNFLIGAFLILGASWFFFIGPGKPILTKVFAPYHEPHQSQPQPHYTPVTSLGMKPNAPQLKTSGVI